VRTLNSMLELSAPAVKSVVLSDKDGPFSKEIPSSYIQEANKEFLQATGKRKPHLRMPDNKVIIAKYTAEHGIIFGTGSFCTKVSPTML